MPSTLTPKVKTKTLSPEAIRLINLIDRADAVYYDGNSQVMPDDKYDDAKRRLRSMVPENHPTLVRVGAPISKDSLRSTIRHARLIGSLNDAMTPDEFRAWWPDCPTIASLKMDGLTLEVTYVDGQLRSAATRGNGAEGDDVTANAVQVEGLPMTLPIPWSGRVRGEIYLKVSVLKAINQELIEEEEDEFANPRNAASGILRSDDGKYADRLSFTAHNAYSESKAFATQSYMFKFLGGLGFDTPVPCLISDIEEAVTHHAMISDGRAKLDFWIDGVVFTIDNNTVGDALGISNSRPKASIAFKFKAERVDTTLTGVEWTVKHSGKLTPRADLAPIKIAGTVVKSASLFNIEEVNRLAIAIGDLVTLQKAGDIIPQIVGVKELSSDRKLITVPTTCPICQSPVSRIPSVSGKAFSVDSYCTSPVCPARVMGLIERYVRSLEIKWLGKELIKALCLGGLVKTPADLYRLKDCTLADFKVNGKRVGVSKAESILAEIEAKRNLTVAQLLGSIGIPHLGKRRVEIMQKKWSIAMPAEFNYLDGANWWVNDLPMAVSGNGLLETYGKATGTPGMIKSIGKAIDARTDLLNDMFRVVEIVSTPIAAKAEAKTTGTCVGRTFCLTGKFSNPKTYYHELIALQGGSFEKDFCSKVTDVVSADTSKLTGKLKQAKERGLTVLNEEELTKLILTNPR